MPKDDTRTAGLDAFTKDGADGRGRGARGVKSRIFGVVLLSVGALNLMLTMKGGLSPELFNYLLILAGVLFLATGALRGGKRG